MPPPLGTSNAAASYRAGAAQNECHSACHRRQCGTRFHPERRNAPAASRRARWRQSSSAQGLLLPGLLADRRLCRSRRFRHGLTTRPDRLLMSLQPWPAGRGIRQRPARSATAERRQRLDTVLDVFMVPLHKPRHSMRFVAENLADNQMCLLMKSSTTSSIGALQDAAPPWSAPFNWYISVSCFVFFRASNIMTLWPNGTGLSLLP